MEEHLELMTEDPWGKCCLVRIKPSGDDMAALLDSSVGSAQRRRKNRVLHHGSIKLHTSDLEGNIATLSESSTCTDPGAFAPHLIEAFQATLGLTFERTAPNPVELEHAAVLGPRYSTQEFLNRR